MNRYSPRGRKFCEIAEPKPPPTAYPHIISMPATEAANPAGEAAREHQVQRHKVSAEQRILHARPGEAASRERSQWVKSESETPAQGPKTGPLC